MGLSGGGPRVFSKNRRCTERDEVRAEPGFHRPKTDATPLFGERMLSLDENPPIMPAQADGIDQLRGPWWVAHTKSRCEKAFAWDLHDQGIGYFLPMSE